AVMMEGGKIQVHLTKRWLDDALRVETVNPLPPNRWYHVAVTYDGSRTAEGVKVYVNGQPEPLRILLDELNQTFDSPAPFLVGAGGSGRFRGLIDEVRIHNDVLSPDEVAILTVTGPVGGIAALPREARSPAESFKLASYYLWNRAP